MRQRVASLFSSMVVSSMAAEDRVDADLSSELDARRPEAMDVSTMQGIA